MRYVLGLDLGTSSLKGLLVNQAGEVVYTTSSDYPLIHPQSGYSEQNPHEWYRAAVEVMANIVETVPDAKEGLEAISFSGQMHSLVLLDENDAVLRNAILWNDVRTTAQCEKIKETLGEELISITQNKALEGFTLPKILWVKEHEPTIFEKARQFLLPKDYLGFRLTGSKQMEYSDAAGTLLLDLKNKQWSEKVLAAFDLPETICPPLVESSDKIGTLSEELTKEFGFTQTINVYAGGADNASAALGAGIISPDIGMASIGTSGVFLAYEEAGKEYQGDLHYFYHVLRDSFYSMGVTLAAGHSLSWFKNTFAPNEDFDALLKDIGTIPAGSEGLLFMPYISGERTPYTDSKIRGSFLGMDQGHTRDHFARAVLEGITFSLKDSQKLMEERAGKNFRKIVSVGGGAKNPDWLQMQADIFDATIVTLTTEQGPGMGAVMLAAMGQGWFDSVEELVATFVKEAKTYEPVKEQVEAYEHIYAIYRDGYGATKDISHALQK